MDPTRTVEGPGWRLEIPATLSAIVATPAPDSDLASLTLVRGWLGEAPVELGISTRQRKGSTLRGEMRRLTSWFTRADAPDGAAVVVDGAHGARRAGGEILLDEPFDGRDSERITAVVAAARHAFVIAVARSSLDEEAWREIDRILASLAIVD
jgi:hypothetical protein